MFSPFLWDLWPIWAGALVHQWALDYVWLGSGLQVLQTKPLYNWLKWLAVAPGPRHEKPWNGDVSDSAHTRV